MPRGKSKSGLRIPRNLTPAQREAYAAAVTAAINIDEPVKAAKMETDAEISERLQERFDILDCMVGECTEGNIRSLIVSGPAGLGKSYTVETHLDGWDPNQDNYAHVKGYVRATGLVRLLYEYRNEGQVLVFDDADNIFFDDVSLNLLKAVCDTTERRSVSWMSEGNLDGGDGESVPRTFDFDGTIIFITNYDFDGMIEANHRLKPHFEALLSRSHYIDLSMKTKRDYLIRIRQVIKEGLLSKLNGREQIDVINFIEGNFERLRELSLRMALKIGDLRKSGGNWERFATVTCLKN